MNEQPLLMTADHQFRCFCTSGDVFERAHLAEFKAFISKKYNKYGYQGFSLEFDDRFDRTSKSFYVRNQSGYMLATLRVTKRTPAQPLSFEYGRLPSGAAVPPLEDDAAEGELNSFAASWAHIGPGFEALTLLFAGVAEYTRVLELTRAFCLLDETNPLIVEVYQRAGFRPSPQFPEAVHFPDYGKVDPSGQFVPTRWTVMQMLAEEVEPLVSPAAGFIRLYEWPTGF